MNTKKMNEPVVGGCTTVHVFAFDFDFDFNYKPI